MSGLNAETVFTSETLADLFPSNKADDYFEALFGDASEGSFDIRLAFAGQSGSTLKFNLELIQRPGKCLACNLTYGLPQVFSRHPVINIEGLVREFDRLLDGRARCTAWNLGATREISPELHIVPLTISIDN